MLQERERGPLAADLAARQQVGQMGVMANAATSPLARVQAMGAVGSAVAGRYGQGLGAAATEQAGMSKAYMDALMQQRALDQQQYRDSLARAIAEGKLKQRYVGLGLSDVQNMEKWRLARLGAIGSGWWDSAKEWMGVGSSVLSAGAAAYGMMKGRSEDDDRTTAADVKSAYDYNSSYNPDYGSV